MCVCVCVLTFPLGTYNLVDKIKNVSTLYLFTENEIPKC